MKPLISFVLTGIFACMSLSFLSAQDSKASIRAAYDALNRRDYVAFTKLCAPDFTEYTAGPEPIKSPQAAIESYKMYFAAFPDLKFTINEIVKGDNGHYYVHVDIAGTNSGPLWMLPPTNKKVTVQDIDIIELNSKGLATSHRSANPNSMLDAIGYGSITNPSTGIVMAAYEKFGKGDIDGILSLASDHVVFEIHDPAVYADPRTFNGQMEVGQFFNDLKNTVEYTKFNPWRFVADGDDVFILVSAEYKHKITGKKISTNYTHQFKITEGRINYFKALTDIQKPYDRNLAEMNIRSLFNEMDAGRSDQFDKYCTSDFMISNPFLPAPAPIQAFQGILTSQKTAFPDMKHELIQLTTDGRFVTVRGIFSGTNTGPMMGNPPTGNKVSVPFIVLDELDTEGRIKNRYVQFDTKSFEAQLMAGAAGDTK